jgi:sterol desaturase/sphingolipid hydroxylase (fatty acid hydroxylase superfamily)
MNLSPIILSIPIYFLLIGIELLIQRFSQKKIYRLNDAVTNISCGITQQLSGVFLKIFGIGLYQLLYENFAIFHIESNVISLIALFVLVDFCYYWAHRMSHEINLFWGSHVVHHQSEDYNFSVALRQSSFQVIWTSLFYFPLAIIGFNTLDFVLMAALTTVYQFWIHTETINKMGWFEKIFNTPSHHRVHHGRDPKYIDKNHAGVFITWDKLFGTFQKEEEKPTYGITLPVDSWNPVWVNFAHYDVMRKEMKTLNFADKIRYLFNKPGWLPKEQGGYRKVKPVDKQSFRKYDVHGIPTINYYVLFQYVIVLASTAGFLFNKDQFSFNENVAICFLIVITVVNCGALFENKTWVWIAEFARIVIFSGIAVFIASANEWDPLISSVGILYFIVSLLFLYLAKNPKQAPVHV